MKVDTDSEEIPVTRDPEAVRVMFGRIAPRYDRANHILSCGADFGWRKRAARMVAAWQPKQVLDLAAGSGDLALAIQRQLPEARIVATDFSPEMLDLALRKGVRETMLADALNLPFESESFECVTVSFGLRNMADWNRALREMARVLAPGGHALILDFSLPSGFKRALYRFYLHRCLPLLAGIVTGERKAYDYLGGSIEKFPSGTAMIRLMEDNGFARAKMRSLSGGIAAIYAADRE